MSTTPIRRVRRLFAALATAALVLAACGSGGSGDADTTAAGGQTPAPAGQSGGSVSGGNGSGDSSGDPNGGLLDFEATAVDGSTVDVRSYAGSDLVIWFWAPW